MSPANVNNNGTQNRPRFTWDIKSVPWTDGKGGQLQYAKYVRRWSAFHDNLDETNSNKIKKKNRGIVLLSNLYLHALDLIFVNH